VETDGPSLLTLPVFYFPGWVARTDGAEAETGPSPADGTIQIAVPPGRHEIDVRFTDTAVRRAGNAVSLIAVLGLLVTGAVWAFRAKSAPDPPDGGESVQRR
jgi:hypothetical protein